MKKKDSILSKELHLIRVTGEENNARAREALAPKYKRINRERKSKFWIWFYYWVDRVDKDRRIKLRRKIMKIQKRRRSLEARLEVMKKNNGYISNGKVKNGEKNL